MPWWPPKAWFKREKPAEPKPVRKRAYKGAAVGRRTYDIEAGSGAGNAELDPALSYLRQRSRQAQRDNALARKMFATLASYASGIMPRSNIPVPPDASKLRRRRIEDANRRVDEVFEEWSKVCNSRGAGNYRGLQFQAVLGMFVSGESFTRERGRRLSDGLPVPVQLEVLEGDMCDHLINMDIEGGGWIRQGVEHNAIGAVTGYRMYQSHPGESLFGLGQSLENALQRVRLSADEVAHLYPEMLERPGMVRGEPWFCANIQGAHDLINYLDAERVKMRAAASQMAAVTSSDQFTFPDENPEDAYGLHPLRDSDGNVIERMKAGQIAYLQSGQTIEWSRPPQSENFESYVRTHLRVEAAGALMPYELYTGDLADTSYASIRFGLNSFNRLIPGRLLLDTVVPKWCAPTWEWFIRAGREARLLPPEAGPVVWYPEPVAALEPDREAKANAMLVRHGAKSTQTWIREQGGNPDQVLRDHETLVAWCIEKGIALDSVPTATTLAGQIQDTFGAPDVSDGEPAPE